LSGDAKRGRAKESACAKKNRPDQQAGASLKTGIRKFADFEVNGKGDRNEKTGGWIKEGREGRVNLQQALLNDKQKKKSNGRPRRRLVA